LLSGVEESRYPEIQKYVLVSSANSFTQWHVDFSGSAVWYYVVEGFKYFYVIDASPEIMEKYRCWHLEERQDCWFPEFAGSTTQLVVVKKGEIIVLPSGCVHCVYTPVDSIAFGGNFLCDEHIEMQLRVEHVYHQIYGDKSPGCMENFRDINALRVIEYCHELRECKRTFKKQKKTRRSSKKSAVDVCFEGVNGKGRKQDAVDLCLQCLYWLKEEQKLEEKKKIKTATNL